MKTIFLYVSGYDYSALDFSRKYSPTEFYQQMKDSEQTLIIIDDAEMYAEIKIVEFHGEISESALDFVKDKLCDYDDLKAADLYWICTEE